MLSFGLACLPLLACLALPGAALADACGSPVAQVSVDMPSASVRVDQVPDVSAYAPFGGGASAAGQGARWVVNGLTKSTYQISFSIEGMRGRDCFAPTAVRIKLGVGDPVQVLISGKYAPGTCPYTAVLEHEMQHVDILRRGRIIYAERFKEMVGQAAAMGPFSSMEQAQEQISGMVDVVGDEMKHAITAAHASIDTAESYLANQSRCPAW